MRNNETGELEFVVGNRQIMSGFFIVVLLFAVGVAMGYFLGQNSPRSAKMVTETSAASPASGTDGRPQPAAPPQAAAQSAQPAAGGDQQAGADAPAQPSTQPVRDTAAATDPATSASGSAQASTAAAVPEAPSGIYWQVMAVQGKGDADVVVKTLKNKGFPATSSPGTRGLTRVLVGPYAERTALGRAKSDLEAAGFGGLYRVEIGK